MMRFTTIIIIIIIADTYFIEEKIDFWRYANEKPFSGVPKMQTYIAFVFHASSLNAGEVLVIHGHWTANTVRSCNMLGSGSLWIYDVIDRQICLQSRLRKCERKFNTDYIYLMLLLDKSSVTRLRNCNILESTVFSEIPFTARYVRDFGKFSVIG